ncbi:MAG: ABC transporter substrate-binding protein [Pseudomonadota bacterium]
MRLPSLLALCLIATPGAAAEFRWSTGSDPQTLDPHAAATAPVLGFLNNVYEGLVRRGRDMRIGPSLAERWEPLGTDGWRFHLRRGVTFHGGESFDADDVLFSYERASSEASDVKAWFAPVREVRVVDDFTIDFLTHAPNPIFPDSIANFLIMDRGWAEAQNAILPARDTEAGATTLTNGTGPFRVVERDPGVRTVLEPFEGWWDSAEHNVTRAIYEPRDSAATMIAALLSGEVDLINPVPLQDVERIRSTDGMAVIEGIEARVIMLGFAHQAETLSLDGTTPNPFREEAVRRAVAQAIEVEAITRVIMEDAAEPVAQLVSPAMRGYSTAHTARPGFDVAAARAGLAEAGHSDGFRFTLACPNDRYLNDEAVCQAVVSMLAQIGLEAQLNAMPVRIYWDTLRAGEFDMYLLGWSPGTFDAEHPLRFLASTPNEEAKLGSWNFGGYSNARIDELLPAIQSEVDDTARQAMLDESAAILQQEVAYVPLYVQPLVWGAREGVEVTQRPDDFLMLRWVQVN